MGKGSASSDLVQVVFNFGTAPQWQAYEISFCEICMESKATSETRNGTSKCSHTYCSQCIYKHIESKLQQNISTVTCPASNCKETLDPYICRDIISRQVLDRWVDALCDSSLLDSQKIYCPFENCSVMLLKDEGVIVRSIQCPCCNRLFCAHCQVPWHSDMTCDQFQERKKTGNCDMFLINLAKVKNWTRCPSCKFYVERVDGCARITCRCSHQFCYKCGNSWIGCRCYRV